MTGPRNSRSANECGARVTDDTRLFSSRRLNKFAAQLDATITACKAGKIGPYKARFFSCQTNDKNASGKGIMIVVPTGKPRTIQVLTSHTSLASEENIADLEKFSNSLQAN